MAPKTQVVHRVPLAYRQNVKFWKSPCSAKQQKYVSVFCNPGSNRRGQYGPSLVRSCHLYTPSHGQNWHNDKKHGQASSLHDVAGELPWQSFCKENRKCIKSLTFMRGAHHAPTHSPLFGTLLLGCRGGGASSQLHQGLDL